MHAIQGTLDEHLEPPGTPLSEVTFVVVDLETTGGSSEHCRITEVGAVKVRGGEVLGEFSTLVNPGEPIPAFIAVLTGITDAMVADAPREDAVLPSFLEFAHGAVLVAHNAPFDIGFLRACARRLGTPWPGARVVDTVALARRLVTRDETPNNKLSSLAAYFGAEQTPDHRALHDARATVDVLHALLGRAGSLGVTTLEDLGRFTSRVTELQRRKKHLAENLPSAPGVYLFKDHTGKVLYVGTSTDIRRRVQSYFTAAEQRSRMNDMIAAAAYVTPVVCSTVLEAQVRELRLIAQHEPPYNRRSRRPARAPWIKLTVEAFPRMSIVREVRDDGADYAGPFGTRAAAAEAIEALHDALPLRRCTTRITIGSSSPACALAEMGRCGAPCDGRQSVGDYSVVARQARAMLAGDAGDVVARLRDRMNALARAERYEDAALTRDRARTLVLACRRAQEAFALAGVAELIAARRRPVGGWEFVCLRFGRVAATGVSPRGADPVPYIDAMVASASVEEAPRNRIGAALPEEMRIVAEWLAQPGTRLVRVEGTWACAVGGAGAHAEVFAQARSLTDRRA